jgi:SAM-dependent methyltransferase
VDATVTSPAQTASAADAASDQLPEYGWGVAALEAKREASRTHQAELAERRDRWIRRNRYYYANLTRLLRFLVEPGKRVLNLRCQTGHLLAAVEPSRGVGVDISKEMIGIAKERHGEYEFVQSNIEDLELDEKFDYVLFTDITDVVDVQQALISVRSLCHDHTRLVIYTYNHLWQPILELSERIGLRMPMQEPNWRCSSVIGASSFRSISRSYRGCSIASLRSYRLSSDWIW